MVGILVGGWPISRGPDPSYVLLDPELHQEGEFMSIAFGCGR